MAVAVRFGCYWRMSGRRFENVRNVAEAVLIKEKVYAADSIGSGGLGIFRSNAGRLSCRSRRQCRRKLNDYGASSIIV